MIKLSQRLQAIANFVPQGAKVADIGTDHGFLPCYLAQSGQAEQVIACDVNAQPLSLAQKNITDYNVADKVSTRLGNGLAVLKPGEVDTVTIAGMGGALMIDILDASPNVVDRLKRIILQPNVGAEAVRVWAEKNRWQIVAEDLVRENDIFSVIIVLEQGRSDRFMSATDLYLGPKLLAEHHPLLGLYISEEWEKAQYILAQLVQSDSEESRKKEKQLRQKWEDINGVIKCKLGVTLS